MMNKKSMRNISAVFCVVMTFLMMIAGYPAQARTIVYVSNADSREIYVLELETKNGSLRTIEKVATAGTVMPLAISPERKFLYAGLRSEPFSVSSFSIDPGSGKLTLIKTTPLADNMAYLSTDRTGRFLFGASYTGNKISVNAIDSSGAVAADPLQIIPTGPNAHCILTDLSNKFLYASTLGDDRLLQYRFNELSGKLTPNDPPSIEIKKGAGPRHFTFHPNRHLVFGINELDGSLNSYLLDAFGRLTLLESNSVMPAGSGDKPRAADLHLTPNGKFLYTSERMTSTISAFRTGGKSGKLKLIGSYPTETQPRGFGIDPKGNYLIAAGQKSNGLSIYKINGKTGALHRETQIEVGKNPNWVEIIELPD